MSRYGERSYEDDSHSAEETSEDVGIPVRYELLVGVDVMVQ